MGFFPMEDVPKAVVARVSTVNARNEPNCTPVWPVFDGKKIYFATDPSTQKLKNLKRNPGIAITFDDYDKKDWSKTFGIMFKGSAQILEKGEEYMHAYRLLMDKYPEYREDPWQEGEVPIIAVSPDKVARWGFEYDENNEKEDASKSEKFRPVNL